MRCLANLELSGETKIFFPLPMREEYPGHIVIEAFPLESTGGKVWAASMRFFDYLNSLSVFSEAGGMRVLELGSGCGWLGMRVANSFPSCTVVMSEQGGYGALHWLKHNISLNSIPNVSAIELDWCSVADSVINEGWDIVFGCELVYSYEGARLLPRLIADLLRGGAFVCYYAHSLNRFESVDELLLEELKKNGLRVQVVYGRDVFAEDYIGSFDTLFRELELVVLKISVS
jgi:hypothetical protein